MTDRECPLILAASGPFVARSFAWTRQSTHAPTQMTSSVSGKLVNRSCFRILFLNCDVSSAGVHGRLSWSAAIVTHLVTQDFLLLVQESEEIRHKRVMTASQASA